MNKSQLIDAAADKASLSKSDVTATLNALIQSIEEAVARGDKVVLTGFGTFERRERAAGKRRNPQTGAEQWHDAKKYPAFKAGQNFKDAVHP